MRLNQAPATLTDQNTALVTTATSQPALRTGFAVLGLVSLLEVVRSNRRHQGLRRAAGR